MAKKDRQRLIDHLVYLCTAVAQDMKNDRYDEGIIGNCRWRLFGIECDSKAAGYLHLANEEHFDRWANSCTIEISLLTIAHEEGNLKSIIEKAVAIYA